MKTLKRAMAWLRKYRDLDLSTISDSLRRRIIRFRIMRLIVLIAAGAWTFVPNMMTLIAGGFGVVCLFILTSIIEPRLDKDLKIYLEGDKKTEDDLVEEMKKKMKITTDI